MQNLHFQVNAEELPPGEYEILAMFDGDDKPAGPAGPVGPVGPVDRAENAKSILHQVGTLLTLQQLKSLLFSLFDHFVKHLTEKRFYENYIFNIF